MPMMPRRPSKKAQKIAEGLNPLLRSAKIPTKKKRNSGNAEMMRRDFIQNARYPEPSN